jgi:hypothetical protein
MISISNVPDKLLTIVEMRRNPGMIDSVNSALPLLFRVRSPKMSLNLGKIQFDRPDNQWQEAYE